MRDPADFMIVLVGTTSSGKSTVVNLLAGREILPVGVQATTTSETRVVHRFDCHAPVVTYDRVTRLVAPDDSPAELVRRAFKDTNDVVRVEAVLESTGWLGFAPTERWSIVELPNIREFARHRGDGPAPAAILSADLVVCVLNAEETDESKERLVFRALTHVPVSTPTLYVLNRVDAFERDAERARARAAALARPSRMIGEGANADRSTQVVPLMARAALASIAAEPVSAAGRRQARQTLCEHASLLAPQVLQVLPRNVERWPDMAAREVAAAVLKHSGANEFLGQMRTLIGGHTAPIC